MESPDGTSRSRSRTEVSKDRTLYWTLSFYIPADRLRPAGAEDAAGPLGAQIAGAAVSKPTRTLRDAIEPLFNDIADRSRLGKVEDRLFAGCAAERLLFVMPATVQWTTEGKTFVFAVPPEHRERKIGLRSFWYAHSNGALSWHLSFAAHYGPDLDRDLKAKRPSTYYFLSLLQKLAWPKEFRMDGAGTTIHQMVGMSVRRRTSAQGVPFWAFVRERFAEDWRCIAGTHPLARPGIGFDDAVRSLPSMEVPGLECPESRSLFFIRDSHLLSLIQPKDASGTLESRRRRVTDEQFDGYPALVSRQRRRGARRIELGAAYWDEMLDQADPADCPTNARDRLAYLFLAGFNQNIIDFTNQEASEVLDSLDPIYPNSDAQEQEGFFVRYANPRAMITYVSRSRTLEVGNDHVGTCPYALLIHALSMHNEALTRAQEESTFAAIDAITAEIGRGHAAKTDRHGHFETAERMINDTRIAAFHVYERHRYANPFRYDTERDVFDELERLRGTSRLKLAYEAALGSLEEQIRDLDRERKAAEDAQVRKQDRQFAALLGTLGIFGVIQVFFQVDQFARAAQPAEPRAKLLFILAYCGIPILAGLFILLYSGRSTPPRKDRG
ncbi:hypothetical protein [Sphingomonas sp. MS122]|uniref:hypothetical protein n=1 Tax=Sphingomonas sp. MS122 TaxID=3412683 RepID=UPI003C2EBDA5